MTGSAKGASAVSLDDRYDHESGEVFLSGNQALVRLVFEQRRRDVKAGLDTASFVTGYPGSPLGGIDNMFRAASKFHNKYRVIHQPAANEELAATSLIGTQMIDQHPQPNADGVVGYWYGKGPGIDRAGDALKHGNFAGTSANGAVVIMSAEDHEAKSSSVPYQQEFAFEHFGIPVLYPASVPEFVEIGQHAISMSRYSGCWVALKLVGPLCDGGETVQLEKLNPEIVIPELEIGGKPFQKKVDFTFFPGLNLETERALYDERHLAVIAYARVNMLDRDFFAGKKDKLGLVAAGKTFTDMRQALYDLGLNDAALEESGIRLRKLTLLCPMDLQGMRDFADGLDEIIVIEEKRDFLERQIARAVATLKNPPRITGKADDEGKPLFPVMGGYAPDQVAKILGGQLRRRGLLPDFGCNGLERKAEIAALPRPHTPHRMPNFCSGCPHNRGTKLAHGQTAWGSPGCHFFASLQTEPTRRIEAITQYGGEGLPWIGLSPFTGRKHLVQNVGDGSLYHSSYLNIRYAVMAGVDMTFKILDNGAIANTGGQQPAPGRTTAQLTRLLAEEGVSHIIIFTKDPGSYRNQGLPAKAEARHIDTMEAGMAELEQVKGVTIAIHDGPCANETKRKQKRGLAPTPTIFTLVNEDVCENCGDCGKKANCMSLQKVVTEFGEKTHIHQSSCHQDQACISGECPSFVTAVTAGGAIAKPKRPKIDRPLPEPVLPALDKPYHLYVPGLGGTGVLTINAILAQAATLDGHRALTYDQTGAAQKWGSVLSSLIITRHDTPQWSNTIGIGAADLYLALDLMAAADSRNTMRCAPTRTAAIINSAILPSGQMIRDVYLEITAEPMVKAIAAVSDPDRLMAFDARRIAEAFFGDYILANMIAVGAAYQKGWLPISATNIEAAIRLNGVKAEDNITAFHAGRLAISDPTMLESMLPTGPAQLADRIAEFDRRPSAKRDAEAERLLASLRPLDAETESLLKPRITDLIDYQNVSWAERYVAQVAKVTAAELAAGVDGFAATRTVSRYLYKLMAYKDEYEVARQLSQKTFIERAKAQFDGPVKLYFNLQPPLLRQFGVNRKVRIGTWILPVMRLIYKMRRIRGTTFDFFGSVASRKEERALIPWYDALIDSALAKLTRSNASAVADLLAVPDMIRGYEDIKSEGIRRAYTVAEVRLAALVEHPALVAAE